MTAASYQTTDNTADGIAHVTCPGRFTSPEVKTNQKNYCVPTLLSIKATGGRR